MYVATLKVLEPIEVTYTRTGTTAAEAIQRAGAVACDDGAEVMILVGVNEAQDTE